VQQKPGDARGPPLQTTVPTASNLHSPNLSTAYSRRSQNGLTARHVRPVKGRSTVGESPNPASRQRSREANLLPSGEIPAVKRGGTELRAAASSEDCRVERVTRKGRGGRAWMLWAKAAFPVMDSGATGNSSGVRVAARSEGWPVNWGEPPAPVARSRAAEACAGIRREPKSGAARRQSERAIVPVTAGTTEPGAGKGPHFGGACEARSG